MIINRKFDYRPIKRETLESGMRYYIDPDNGERLTSVTSILSRTADKTALLEWREFLGSKKADAICDEACALGTLIHTHLEKHILGEERPRGNNHIRVLARNMSNEIINHGFCHVDEVYGLEVGLYVSGLTAGTADLVGVYDGVDAILDYKTSKSMKKREQIQDYFCQTAAYAQCHNYQFNTNIRRAVIFMVDRSLQFNTFILEGRDFDLATKQWENRLLQYENSEK